MAAENKENFDDTLVMKIHSVDLDKFKMKCAKSYTTMLREIIKAFNDDRIRIIPTDEQKESLKIYQE